MKRKALVIGAGLGGLATGLRLSTRGYEVTILEKHSQAGGRLNQIEQDGFTFDMGPSFFSMSYEFDELFNYCGLDNPLVYEELNPLYVVNFSNGRTYKIYKELGKLAEEFKKVEPDFEKKVIKYLDDAGKLFHDTEGLVVKKNFNSKLDYLLTLTKVPWKHSPKMFRSMWNELGRYFESRDAKVIFSLVAFFLGSTPFDTPAVYKLLNYTELKHDGYWNIKGGMYKIVEALLSELEKRGVSIHYNTEITGFNQNGTGVKGFIDKNGKVWEADLFISNSDAASFRGNVLKRDRYYTDRLDEMDWTLSPFTIYLGVKGKLDNLYHHNYLLGENFEEYASKIFKMSISPDKPYYYVNVSSKSNPDSAPEGCENIFILCPVPDLRYKKDWSDKETLADNIISDLSNRTDFDIKKNLITKRIVDPVEWENTFNLYRGSGLGLAHGLNQIGGFRPRNKDEELKNLYYVGASTVPGTGLPIVTISSKLVTERILQDDKSVQ